MAVQVSKSHPVQYEGYTFQLREKNGYHDSDFYAVCWNKETNTLDTPVYATTRFGGGGWATVDATDETKKEVLNIYIKLYSDDKAKYIQEQWKKNYKINKGDLVTVVKGTKVPKGIEGTIFWMKQSPYGTKIGIGTNKGADGKYQDVYWTYLKNVEPVEYKYEPSFEYFRNEAINDFKFWINY